MHDAGFVDIKLVLPVKVTNYKDIFDDSVLSKEWEVDFVYPHTLMIEGIKLI